MIMENEGKVIFLGYIINCFGNLFFKVDEKERWEKFCGIIEWFFFIDGFCSLFEKLFMFGCIFEY